jgi:hypothetical protein
MGRQTHSHWHDSTDRGRSTGYGRRGSPVLQPAVICTAERHCPRSSACNCMHSPWHSMSRQERAEPHRRVVERRPHAHVRHVRLAVAYVERQPKVGELREVGEVAWRGRRVGLADWPRNRGEHYVLRLEVAVHDVAVVQVPDAARDVECAAPNDGLQLTYSSASWQV